MKSASKINHDEHSGGTLLNLKFTPGALQTDRGIANLAAMIRAYFELGAFHVQFNVISKETLLAAQKNPRGTPGSPGAGGGVQRPVRDPLEGRPGRHHRAGHPTTTSDAECGGLRGPFIRSVTWDKNRSGSSSISSAGPRRTDPGSGPRSSSRVVPCGASGAAIRRPGRRGPQLAVFRDRCRGCAACVSACTRGAARPMNVDRGACEACGVCSPGLPPRCEADDGTHDVRGRHSRRGGAGPRLPSPFRGAA